MLMFQRHVAGIDGQYKACLEKAATNMGRAWDGFFVYVNVDARRQNVFNEENNRPLSRVLNQAEQE